MPDKEPLKIYTIYDHPADYPDYFVVRRRLIHPDSRDEPDPTFFVQSTNLDVCREMLLVDFGLVCLGRSPNDDKTILESWI